MNFTLKIWRQKTPKDDGHFETYEVENISPDASFLEMLDVLNNQLVIQERDPVAFDHDCREGICGSCGLMINGRAHGPGRKQATCDVECGYSMMGKNLLSNLGAPDHFLLLKDLVVDRTALDRMMQAGGFISARTGGAPDANSTPITKANAEESMDAAACIGCGACVAACPNSSAMLFVAAKVSQFALLPQGQVERKERVQKMVMQMDKEGFGNCSNNYACEAECPKGILVTHIARLNREFLRAKLA